MVPDKQTNSSGSGTKQSASRTQLKSQFVLAVTFVFGQGIYRVYCWSAVLILVEVMNTRPNLVSDKVTHLTSLTERQRQVAALACQGLSNKKIAEELGLAEGTVKIHLNAIYVRLDVRSRTKLIVRFGRTQAIATKLSLR
jgi:DNA-binding NarL/FixJ family response regulator